MNQTLKVLLSALALVTILVFCGGYVKSCAKETEKELKKNSTAYQSRGELELENLRLKNEKLKLQIEKLKGGS